MPLLPKLSTLLRSVTVVTAGWMCSVMKPSALMLGVTSSEIPEKNGCNEMVGVVVPVPLPVPVPVLLVVDTLVTKKSSVPTFNTAFWLFMVAMRGLDSTCVLPCVPKNSSTAAKLVV